MIPKAVEWRDGVLRLLDQTRLPHAEIYLDCRDIETVYEAIASLRVRGAPAIGIAAGFGLMLPFRDSQDLSGELTGDSTGHPRFTFDQVLDETIQERTIQDTLISRRELERRADYLVGARPTAVNLSWAINRVLSKTSDKESVDVRDLFAEAEAIYKEDAEACRAIGRFGAGLIERHPRVLTHCNAGALAVSELGTALAPVYVAHHQGVEVHVYVDETRPLLQGARLTAWELQRAGVPLTLIADNMAAYVMGTGEVDLVVVGADRVAANGDVANKIGTLNLAILCRYFDIPFVVACPWSTIDLNTPAGRNIVIEYRAADEVRRIMDVPISTIDVDVLNPAFDVTPANLVSCFITERGVIQPPYDIHLAAG